MPVPRRADAPERLAVPDRVVGAAWSLIRAWRAFAREVGVPRRRRPFNPQTRGRAIGVAAGAVLALSVLVFVPWARAATTDRKSVV